MLRTRFRQEEANELIRRHLSRRQEVVDEKSAKGSGLAPLPGCAHFALRKPPLNSSSSTSNHSNLRMETEKGRSHAGHVILRLSANRLNCLFSEPTLETITVAPQSGLSHTTHGAKRGSIRTVHLDIHWAHPSGLRDFQAG